MKRIFLSTLILLGLAWYGYAETIVPVHTYQLVTSTAWTTADSTPVIVKGTTTVAGFNFNASCNSWRIWENSLSKDLWFQYITTLGASPDASGVWIAVPAGKDYANEMMLPRGGIAVKTTATATIDFESKK
jgi:hypothetical protein